MLLDDSSQHIGRLSWEQVRRGRTYVLLDDSSQHIGRLSWEQVRRGRTYVLLDDSSQHCTCIMLVVTTITCCDILTNNGILILIRNLVKEKYTQIMHF